MTTNINGYRFAFNFLDDKLYSEYIKKYNYCTEILDTWNYRKLFSVITDNHEYFVHNEFNSDLYTFYINLDKKLK